MKASCAALISFTLLAACDDTSFRALAPANCAASSASAVQAMSSEVFVDSICANAFVSLYADKVGLVQQKVADAGFRFLGVYYRFKPELLKPVVAEGARLQVTADSLVPDIVAFAKALNPGLHTLTLGLAVAPPTEPTALATWGTQLKNYLQTSSRALKADPGTKQLKVTGPILANMAPGLVGNMEEFVDYGSVNAWNDGNPGNATLDDWIRKARVNYPTKPLVVGQIGYSLRRFSPAVQAKYLPRMFLEHAKRGIVRTCFDYLIKNTADEIDLGLVAWDGSSQPAFKSLSNLIGAVEAPGGAAFTPGRLAYSIEGASDRVHQLLLQGPSGTFTLALWLEVTSTDQDAFEPAVVKLSAPAATVVVRRLDNLDSVIKRAKDASTIELMVPDTPILISISPGC